MAQQWAFLQLYDSVSAIPRVSFDFATMDEEGFVLAEEMCNEGMEHLIKLKTDILNAKHKLQAPDLQRGVLPQTEEGKEGVSVKEVAEAIETYTDKDKIERLTKQFYSQPIQIMSRQESIVYQKAGYPPKHGLNSAKGIQ